MTITRTLLIELLDEVRSTVKPQNCGANPTNETVIGAHAVGLGTNTTVIGTITDEEPAK